MLGRAECQHCAPPGGNIRGPGFSVVVVLVPCSLDGCLKRCVFLTRCQGENGTAGSMARGCSAMQAPSPRRTVMSARVHVLPHGALFQAWERQPPTEQASVQRRRFPLRPCGSARAHAAWVQTGATPCVLVRKACRSERFPGGESSPSLPSAPGAWVRHTGDCAWTS